MSAPTNKLSRSAYDRMVKRLEHLKTVERARIAELKVQVRADRGDAVDHASGFFGVTHEEGMVEDEIRRLEDRLREVEIVDDGATGSGRVAHGSLVTVRFVGDDDTEEYLVASVEERTDVSVCTPESPLGRALLGASAGDTVTYDAPTGLTLSVEVVEVAG